MPQEGYKSVSLPEDQIELIKKYIGKYSHIIGAKSVAEFYFTAAAEKIKATIALLKLREGSEK